MAKKRVTAPGSSFVNPARVIEESELGDELEKSFLEYSYSVIMDRALPDARDGMKPVHRRLMYGMFESSYTPDKPYVKSAKVVGHVMGTYHPHGDSAIYEALVRLTQPFAMMLPLADGKGNWGSPDDGAAAARYTEVRLHDNAMLMVGELKEDVVPMTPNYDGTKMQPEVLPVQYPNLLVNGGSGIAVGMATKMPTHNPGEIMDAARWLLTHPNASLDKLMEFVPGPDFPTGGSIIGIDAIREAYETGRGVFKIRGSAEVEPGERGKSSVVVTELPYGVGAESLIEKAIAAIKDNKLVGIADIKDLSDRRQGTRIVFVVKAGVNPNAVLSELYRHTPLETSFGVNNTVLVEGKPQTLGLKELLQIFIDHRLAVVLNRSIFRKEKREKRLHLVEGLLKALLDIDKVIALVRSSENADAAREGLIKQFKVDQIQADYILSLQLRRLTKFDQIELNNERDTLKREIAELTKIINDEAERKRVVGDELTATKKQIAVPRRSEIVATSISEHVETVKAAAQSVTFEVEDKSIAVAVYADGAIRRVEDSAKAKAYTKGGTTFPVIDVVNTRLKSNVILVTNKGRGIRTDCLHITDRAAAAGTIVDLEKGERVIAVSPVTGEGEANLGTFFATKKGTVKITNPDYPLRSDSFELISLDAGDEIVVARWLQTNEGAEVALLSSDSSLLRFPADKIRPQGRSGAGIAGIKLADGAEVVAASVLTASEVDKAVVVTSTGESIKVTPFSLYPPKGRATGGVRSHKFLKGEEKLIAAGVVTNPTVIDSSGNKMELPAIDKRRDGSGAKIGAQVGVIGWA